MKKFFARFLVRLGKLGKRLEEEPMNIEKPQEILKITQTEVEVLPPKVELVSEEQKPQNDKSIEKKPKNKSSKNVVEFNPRDIMEVMEIPFLSLSKKRTKPISYKSKDGEIKVNITPHTNQYLASIYDWDIIQCISGRIQEAINLGHDIPSKNIVIQRSKLLKELRKDDGKKARKEIEQSLSRLKLTGIETTIRNEDYRYKGGFGFIDSWGYTERKDAKEFRITLSDWLYDGICAQGALLKVNNDYFALTSAIKKFLYRTARKHVGNNDKWEFSIEKLYEKSASEQEFKKFKYDLKKAVTDNDIPDYFLEWREDFGKISVHFSNKRKELIKMLTE